MEKKGRITQIRETRVVDNETGEILKEIESSDINIGSEPDFIKVYLEDLSYLANLPKSSGSVLFSIAKRMGYDNKVVLVKPIKTEIAKENEITLNSLDNIITRLKRSEILLSVDRSVYTINPYYIGKGYWKDIKKLRMEIEYSSQGRSIKFLSDSSDLDESKLTVIK